MKINKWGALALLLLASGCATPEHVINYAPSSTMTVAGDAKVGNFRYIPSEIDSEITPNQIRNTAMNDIKFEKNIHEYFETAVFSEFRLVGIKIDGKENVVTGEISEFIIDDLGYSVDWTLDVRYVVKRPDNSVCYDQFHSFKKHTPKFGNTFGTLNEVIKSNIELALSDPAFVKCIGKDANATTT